MLASPAGDILLPGTMGQVGTALRLSIPAQDVMLSRARLEGQSAQNMLVTTITGITPLPNGNQAVVLQADQAQIWAEITPLSVDRLGLAPGQSVHAIFKATAIGPT